MALQISLGYTSDDYRVINKSVTYVVNAVGCKVIHPNDIVTPTLELEYNSSYDSCNYAYLPEFHRYYYIEDITQTAAKTCIIHLKSDPLKSIESWLLAKDDFNLSLTDADKHSLIPDGSLVTLAQNETRTYNLSGGNLSFTNNNTFDTANRTYVLVIA